MNLPGNFANTFVVVAIFERIDTLTLLVDALYLSSGAKIDKKKKGKVGETSEGYVFFFCWDLQLILIARGVVDNSSCSLDYTAAWI